METLRRRNRGQKAEGLLDPNRVVAQSLKQTYFQPKLFMRLSMDERSAILTAVRQRDPAAEVYLFGSRADDRRKGGDIDLLVLSDRIGFREIWPIRRDILDRIGWQKLDLLVERPGEAPSAFGRVARETGCRL